MRVELVPPCGVHRRVRLFGHQIGQAFGPVGHIALGTAERPPVLRDAPNLFIGVDEVIARANLTARNRAFVDHEIQHFVEPFIEQRVIEIEIACDIPSELRFEYIGRDIGIGFHLGTGIIHG